MTIVLGNHYRIAAAFERATTGAAINVFHVKIAAEGTGGDPGAISDMQDYIESIYTLALPHISAQWGTDYIQINQAVTGDPVDVSAWPTLGGGGASGDTLPEGTCPLLIGRTATSRVIGKKYLPAMVETSQTDGLIGATALAAFANAANQWIADYVGANGWTLTPEVFNRATFFGTSFTEALVRSVFAYQRRRKRGVGG